MTPSFANIKD
uniref:Uncharacterized protein n=1 Tax=Anguilla anguilla TaxID=7936 RepID=A0A0E9TP59_ANGAN